MVFRFQEGDKWSICFEVLVKSNTITFEIGKEFTEENPVLGDTNKCIAEVVDDKIVMKTQHEKSGTKATRTFIPTNEGMTMVSLHFKADLWFHLKAFTSR